MRKFAILFLLTAASCLPARAETVPVEAALALVAQGEILPLATVLHGLQPVDGDIIEVALDRQGARYLYRIKALDQNGRYLEYVLDAKTGASEKRTGASEEKTGASAAEQ